MSKVKAGEAYVSITCDNSKLKSGLNVAKKSIDSFGKNATISVAVSAAGIGYCMKQLSELQDQMLTLQGVTGKTQTEMKGLEAQAKKLGATTSWTAGQVAEGMVALARLGQTCDQISSSIEPVMNLAKGLGVSVAEAADMVGASLNQFKMSADKASKVADVLAKATNSAAISNTELATSLKYAGTSGAQMGQSLESVTALVMQLRNLGYDAQQAGTIVRGFFLDLQDPKKAKAFESVFNVNLKDAAGNFRPILAVLDEASKKAQEMGSSLVENLRKIEFTKANVGGIAELLNSTPSLRRFNDTLKDSAGYADQLAKTMDSGTSGAVKLMKSAVDGLAITVGQTFEKDFVTAVKAVTNLADTASNFVKKNERLIVGLGKTAASVSFLASALVLARKFGGGLLGMVTGLASALTGMASAASRFLNKGQDVNVAGGGGAAFRGAKASAREAELAFISTQEAVAKTTAEIDNLRQAAYKASNSMFKAQNDLKNALAVGDKQAAKTAFNDMIKYENELKNANKQADVLVDKNRLLQRSLVQQEKQIKSNSSAWGKVSKALSGISSAMTSMLLFTTIATAVKDVFDWLSKSASKMKQQADDAERFRDAMRDAYSQNNTVEGQKAQVSNIEETLANRFKYKDLSEKERAQNDAELLKMKQQGILSEEQYKQLTSGNPISASDQAFIRQSVLTNNFNRANNAGQKNADTMYNSTQQEIATKLGFLNTTEAERDAISSMMRKYEGLGGAEYARKHGVQAMLDQMNLTEAESNAFNKFNEASAKMNPTAGGIDVAADTLTRMSVYSILAEQNRLGYNNAVNLAQDATLTDAERSAKFAESIRDANSTFSMARGTAEGFGATSWYNPLKNSAIAIQDAVDFAKSSFAEVAKMPLDLAASNEYQRTVLAEFNKPAELPAMPAGLPGMPDDTEAKPTIHPNQPTVDPITASEAQDAQDAAKKAADAAEAAEQAMNAVFADSQDYNKSFEEIRKEAEEDWNKRLSEAMKAFDVNANRANARAVLRLVREGKREGYDTSDILNNNMQDRKRNREDLNDLFKKLQVNVSAQSKVMDSFTGTHTAAPQVNLQQQSLAKMNQFVAETQQQIRLLQQQLAQQNQIIRILQ